MVSQKKRRQKIHSYLRLAVQVVFFLLFPSAYSASFAGVKYIFTQIGARELIQITPFVAVLIALCGYTIVFGRFFCGYACAFGSLGDWIFAVHSAVSGRRMKRPARIPAAVMAHLSVVKYVLLALIIVLCAVEKFGLTTGWSPWDAFSQIRAGQFTSLGGYLTGCVLLGGVLAGMFFSERFFCRVLCPMGAVFSLLPVLPLFSMHRDRQSCIKGCSGCRRICPGDLELPDRGSPEVPGDCFQCHRCIGVCPRGNVSAGIGRIRGDEFQVTVLRALLLAGLFLWLGV